MGVSASSLLDDAKSQYIKGQADAELQSFAPFYRKQFSVARLSQVEDDLGPSKQKVTQLLKQREVLEEASVLYEEGLFYFDDSRKWKERYVVVRANHSLECHDSLESFVKGFPPRHKLLPTGGTVLSTEESYMKMVDQCFPGDSSVKEDFVPPLSGMPGQFPVYLRLPYRRDSYFCFRMQTKHNAFVSVLSDCIRHQNQDFLKKRTCEVQAFVRAVTLYRETKGKYQGWDLLIGSDVRVMANLVMEELLPSLEKEMLPRLKAKKTEKKRVWFVTVEAAYILVQEHLLEGLAALKDECRASLRQQEVLIHSDMDRLLECRERLEKRTQDKVSAAVEKLCNEEVWPHLGAVLEELMEPISEGFSEGRQMSQVAMEQLHQDVLQGAPLEQLRKSGSVVASWDLLPCFQKIDSLKEKLPRLQQNFGFTNSLLLIQRAQIDLEQLMDNMVFTFEQLLLKALQENPDDPEGAAAAVNKARHRVLKNFDYDSSTVRKRIFQEELVSITLPFIKKKLNPTFKSELQDLEQLIEAEHSPFIHMENIYENVLLQTVDKEVTKVVKEAASLKKYNLFTDSNRSSLSSPTDLGSCSSAFSSEIQPPSILKQNGSLSSPHAETDFTSNDVEMTNPQNEVQDLGQHSAVVKEETDDALTDVTSPPIKVEVTNPETEVHDQVCVSESLVLLESIEEDLKTDLAALEVTVPLMEGDDSNNKPSGVPDELQTLEVGNEELKFTLKDPAIPLTKMKDKLLDLEVQENVQTKASLEQIVKEEKDLSVPPMEVEVKPSESELQDHVLMNVKETDVALNDLMNNLIETEGKELKPEVQNQVKTEMSQVTTLVSSEGITPLDVSGKIEMPSGSDPTVATVNTSQETGLTDISEPKPVGPSEITATEKPSEETAGTINTSTEQQTKIPEVEIMPPPSGEAPVEEVAPPGGKCPVGHVLVSGSKLLEVSGERDSPASDLESTDEVSTTSDILEDETRLSTPVSSDADDKLTIGIGGAAAKEAPPTRVEAEAPAARALDCVREIRDLVMEVIEVEELVQRYPDRILKEE